MTPRSGYITADPVDFTSSLAVKPILAIPFVEPLLEKASGAAVAAWRFNEDVDTAITKNS